MLIIACSLALLVIYAGAKLGIQVKLNALNRLYGYISWFMIIMGFLLVLGTGAAAAFRCCQAFSGMHGSCGGHHQSYRMHAKNSCGGDCDSRSTCKEHGDEMCGHAGRKGSGMACRHGEEGMGGAAKCCGMGAMQDHSMMKGHMHGRDSMMMRK